MRSGDAFNVVPATGELIVDIRADHADAINEVVAAVPPTVGEARMESELLRVWPGMDARAATASVLERATSTLGRPVVGVSRGGASDASHFASAIPLTIDGLGPRGGAAHNPGEYVLAESPPSRAPGARAGADAVRSAA